MCLNYVGFWKDSNREGEYIDSFSLVGKMEIV